MTLTKQQYLDSIRHDSAYPIYRSVIGLIASVFYGLAAVFALGAVIGGLGAMTSSFLTGLVTLVVGAMFAALYYLIARLFKEAALILVDMGDSTLEANSRARQGSAAGAH